MKVTFCKTLVVAVAIVGIAIIGAGAASAQTDVYQLTYFSNNVSGAPDATVRTADPGLTYGTNNFTSICAMIYVFDKNQEMSECCGCPHTHNDLWVLSVGSDLTSNPLTGKHLATGVIKIVSAAVNNFPCDPTSNVHPLPNLRSWATHIQNKVPLGTFGGSVYPITEEEFADSALGATELANLQAQCAFIGVLGSGTGICSCGKN